MIQLVKPVLALAGLVLGGCSVIGGGSDIGPNDKVRDEAAAVAIGERVCGEGTKAGFAYNFHAKRDGNNWNVWAGPKYDGHHVMELKVNKATGEATECLRYAG